MLPQTFQHWVHRAESFCYDIVMANDQPDMTSEEIWRVVADMMYQWPEWMAVPFEVRDQIIMKAYPAGETFCK